MFKTRILLGIGDLWNRIEAAFSKKDHNHDDTYVKKSDYKIYITSRYKKTLYGETWIVTEYNDKYCVCEGIVADLIAQKNTAAASRYIRDHSRYVDLPIEFADNSYHIQITNNIKHGCFSWGSGLCGYGLPLVGSTNNGVVNGKYPTYFVLLECYHYWSYNIKVSGYKK